MNVYLIRHTSVDIPSGICYGRTDVPLAVTFMKECIPIMQHLPVISTVYSSPLQRCTLLADQLTSDYIIDPSLQEYNFGEWEMQSWDAIKQSAIASKWFADFVHQRPPNGDTYEELQSRIIRFWKDIIMPQAEKRLPLAIITHAGIIRALLSHLLHIPLEHSFKITVDKGSVTKLTIKSTHEQINYINWVGERSC